MTPTTPSTTSTTTNTTTTNPSPFTAVHRTEAQPQETSVDLATVGDALFKGGVILACGCVLYNQFKGTDEK